MSGTKRALLIGSSYEGLQGTENDVEIMATILKDYGFPPENIVKLVHNNATRVNILEKWDSLIQNSSEDDTVVIYYSGHGGYATPMTKKPALETTRPGLPSHFQYLIPCDFDGTLREWKGILDIEVSRLLYRTTTNTKNVTYILDCCHASRLGRAPNSSQSNKEPPVPKVARFELDDSLYADIWENAKIPPSRRPDPPGSPDFTKDDYSNCHVVRISAAAAEKTAWQHLDGAGNWVGIFTENLGGVFPSLGRGVSWRNIMLMVGALVKQEFKGDPQQPRSAGPDYRLPFLTNMNFSRALLAEMCGEDMHICGGRVLGVEKGDRYTVTPWDRSSNQPMQLVIAEVTTVNGFTSTAKTTTENPPHSVAAWAFLTEKLNRWLVAIDGKLQNIRPFVEQSPIFRLCELDDEWIIKLQQVGESVVLYGRDSGGNDNTHQAVRLGSRLLTDGQAGIDEVLLLAETFARARNIVSLGSGTGVELFRPDVQVDMGLIGSDKKIVVLTTVESGNPPEPIEIMEGQRIFFEIRNMSNNKASEVHVSMLSVDATGRTKVLSRSWERGIRLTYDVPNASLKTGESGHEGLLVGWPGSITRGARVYEYFVFIMTKEEVDLRFLETQPLEPNRIARGPREGFSLIPQIPYCVASVRYSLTTSQK